MCGISGIYRISGAEAGDEALIRAMNKAQAHRGPDDEGVWTGSRCSLGHKRLSIIDLSSDGHQPFISDDGRYILTFNGEIYNYIELRDELRGQGCSFRTRTDIEVLMRSFIHWGEDCLSRFNGMFAFAIYDTLTHELFFARDRFGIKPLYYFEKEGVLVFASEIKALKAFPGWRPEVNEHAIFDYLCFNRTDVHDETFMRQVKRLPKGCKARISQGVVRISKWWNPLDYLTPAPMDRQQEAEETIRELFLSSLTLRMRSDVPVGSCLSGGLDSSIIIGALFHHLNPGSHFRTFTASFPGFSLDETAYVDALNQEYPFENHRVFPDAASAFDDLERFVYTNDEPTTGPSFYSQYRVMQLAREKGITVLLDGQGGDESFAGYQYFHGFNFTGLLHRRQYLKLSGEIAKALLRRQDKEAFYTFIFQNVSPLRRKKLLKRTLPHISHEFFYDNIENSLIFKEFFEAEDLNHSIARHFQYKLEHLLRMEDRNSMAFQIEARLPYLDYRLVEFLLSLPAEMKIRKGENKLLQKRALGQYTIPKILDRRDKIGFGTPGREWMQHTGWSLANAEHYRYLQDQFPGVFTGGLPLKNSEYDRWKISQLAVWHHLFITSL